MIEFVCRFEPTKRNQLWLVRLCFAYDLLTLGCAFIQRLTSQRTFDGKIADDRPVRHCAALKRLANAWCAAQRREHDGSGLEIIPDGCQTDPEMISDLPRGVAECVELAYPPSALGKFLSIRTFCRIELSVTTMGQTFCSLFRCHIRDT